MLTLTANYQCDWPESVTAECYSATVRTDGSYAYRRAPAMFQLRTRVKPASSESQWLQLRASGVVCP